MVAYRSWTQLNDMCKECTRQGYIIELQNEGREDVNIWDDVPEETLANYYSDTFFVPEDFGDETWEELDD